MKHPKSNNQRGFTLGELGLVLLVVGIIAYFAYPKYLQHTQTVLAQEEMDSVTQYVGNFQKAYKADPDYSTVSTAIGVQLGYFDTTMIQGTTAYNKYQGTVTVVPNQVTNPNDTALFTTTNYSLAGCQQVVPGIAQISRTMTVNGTTVQPLDQPLVKTTLGTACASTNTVTFVISK